MPWNIFHSAPKKNGGRFAFLKQFRNRIFIDYPFNLDDVNNCKRIQEDNTNIVHKKQPPFFMYVKEDSDMLWYRHSQGNGKRSQGSKQYLFAGCIRQMDVHTASVLMPQLYLVDDRPCCLFSLCMHPAIFMPQHRGYIITFVSQGAHWRTDAHNGKQCLWSV